MALKRFSISLDEQLLKLFDKKIAAQRCPTRSKAVADLIRAALVETEWRSGGDVAGAIVLVYDHHRHGINRKLTEVQHRHLKTIISTQHIHLDHDNCLEIVAVRGKPSRIETLTAELRAIKGLKHVSVAAGTTGIRLA